MCRKSLLNASRGSVALPRTPGRKLGPRIHLTGTIVYGADGTSRCEINTDNDAMDRLQQ